MPIEQLLKATDALPHSQRERIIINGERSFGVVKSNRERWSEALDSLKARAGESHAGRLQIFAKEFTESELASDKKLSQEITQAIERVGDDCLINQDGQPTLVLDDKQITLLDMYIAHELPTLRESLAKMYAERLNIYSYLKESALLTKAQAVEELRHIAAENDESGVVIYLYTNGVDRGLQHVEAALVYGHQIANLVPYTVDFEKRLSRADPFDPKSALPEMFLSAPELLVSDPTRRFSPQASATECVTLSFLAALIYSNMRVREASNVFIDSSDPLENKKIQFFVPHPRLLGYSQSSLYNKLILAFVNETDALTTVEHKGEKIEIRTLESFAPHEINNGRPFDKTDFRNLFNQIYNNSREFRDRFDVRVNGQTTNVNLSHANELLLNFDAKLA